MGVSPKTSGPLVILLHGGPGAGGYLTPLARALADSFRVIEPLQRRSGDEPLTVAAHVGDLDELVVRDCEGGTPALVGHSWGAMLALAYAAAHPNRVRALVLIGCGTFDQAARDRMRVIIDEGMDDDVRRRIERLPEECPDPDERLRVLGNLMLPLYSYDAAVSELNIEVCDSRAHDETWWDMLRLQREAVYPSAFAAIVAPVLMIHGAVDPHPGRLIRATLLPYLARLEYRELERCGHYPWLETGVRDEFFAFLRQWLAEQFAHRIEPHDNQLQRTRPAQATER
jgi:pimeloyl-ACP methyl ester carboxylesterase